MAYNVDFVTPVVTSRAGVAMPTQTPMAQMSFKNNEQEVLYVKNGSASSINVTIHPGATVDGMALPDKVIAVAAGAERLIGPFPKGIYNQPSPYTANINVDFSATASVIVGIIDFGSL